MGNVLIIDDDPGFTSLLESYIHEICPLLKIEICNNPLAALALIRKGNNELILIDLEMPALDGMKIYKYATESGVQKGKIVILSAREPNYLREFFPMGSCLAVLNKFEAKQKEVLGMILKSVQSKLCTISPG
ncbi:MAG: response regulator [Geobacteraceae bacterium]|nr:response regulator [Geobacteraceae bacterium]